MVAIQDRASWQALAPKTTPTPTTVVELYVHHSVGSGFRDKDGDGDLGDDYMRQMQWDHMFGSHDWNDIAYNHAHDPDGREFYEGRGFGIRPGAQRSHNTGTHALVIMGDFRVRKVTDQLIADIAAFYRDAMRDGILPKVNVQGHQQAPDQTTTCPGDNLMAALPEINRLIQEEHPMEKIPVQWWAEEAFKYLIENGYYTETKVLADVRETYEFQQLTVNNYRENQRQWAAIEKSAGAAGVSVEQFNAHVETFANHRHAGGTTGKPK